MRDLFHEYASGAADLAAFFGCRPLDLFTGGVETQPLPLPLVDEIAEYQRRLGLTRSLDGTEIYIVTGQQPALLTGPLYTVYKAVTTIRAAAKLEAKLGRRCIPVFWMASDDHEFDEARVAHVLTKQHEPRTLRYEPAHDVEGLPLYRVPAEPGLHELVAQAADATPGSEFRHGVESFLHHSLDAADSFSDWTARLLARLFQDTALMIFAPHLREARRLAADVLEQEIAQPLISTRLLNESGAQLESLGFPRQISKAANECNFFVEIDGKRRKVVWEDERYFLPEEGLAWSPEGMLRLLRESPDRFSPNVALRCLVQQRVFDAAGYVAGPAETAYWAQLRPLFDRFGRRMPVVYPRVRCTLSTVKTNQLMARFGLGLEDLTAPVHALVDRTLAVLAQGEAYNSVRRRRAALEEVLAGLRNDLAGADATAAEMAGRLEQGISADLDRLERTVLRADTARVDAAHKQVARVCNTLCPWRKPQERVYTVFSFLFGYGWGLIPRLINELDIASFRMNEVEL